MGTRSSCATPTSSTGSPTVSSSPNSSPRTFSSGSRTGAPSANDSNSPCEKKTNKQNKQKQNKTKLNFTKQNKPEKRKNIVRTKQQVTNNVSEDLTKKKIPYKICAT